MTANPQSPASPESATPTPLSIRQTHGTRPLSKDTVVLVVEDNVSNFVLIARLLGYLGVHCEWKPLVMSRRICRFSAQSRSYPDGHSPAL